MMDEPLVIRNLTNDELALLYEYRAKLEQAPLPSHVPQRRTPPSRAPLSMRVTNWLFAVLALLLIVVFALLLAGRLGLAAEFTAATPVPASSPGAAPSPQASAPGQRPALGAAAAPDTPSRVYDQIVSDGWRGAWAPDQPATLEVTGRHYAQLANGTIELDDGTVLWLLPVSSVAPPAAQSSTDAQDMARPSANGTAGMIWGAGPTAQPAPPQPTAAPRPTAPLTFDPAHAGPGGSSGGSTWGQP